MGSLKHVVLILVILLLIPCNHALSYDYTWDNFRVPFTQLIRVPGFRSGTSTVVLDLPQDVVNAHESLKLNLDLESGIVIKIDGLEQRTFERWSAYCSVNGAFFLGKHRLRVNDVPPRQTSAVSLNTKDLKAGKNTLTFSMSPTGSNVRWNQIPVAYVIHKMWFSEFSTISQGMPEKVKDVPIDKLKPYSTYLVKAVSVSPVSTKGNKCGESTATLYIQGNVVKAIGHSTAGGDFEASGTINSNGQLKIGVASGKDIFATFTGLISGDSGNGVWQDQSQCYGTWIANKQSGSTKKKGDSEIETKLIGLKQLLEKGLITQEDYDRKRAELLDQL